MNIWTPTEEELTRLDAIGIRDLIITCFEMGQKETIARVKSKHGSYTDDDILKSAIDMLKSTFERMNADFDNPKISDFPKVLEKIQIRGRMMGTPKDIAERHAQYIKTAITRAIN